MLPFLFQDQEQYKLYLSRNTAIIQRAIDGGDWQPISTAPRQRFVLLNNPKGTSVQAAVGRYTRRFYGTHLREGRFLAGSNMVIYPTHWRPLPAPLANDNLKAEAAA
ncbi:hypothetical protein ACM41_20310 [Bradyrhizobium sp. CCBAU 21362]|nr:hypothetical protein AF336_06255 [Bradyrhizobium diazoefficiens]MDA9538469.1 hypothetical protein [Bradyrhizobium sp. CCBAU 21362]